MNIKGLKEIESIDLEKLKSLGFEIIVDNKNIIEFKNDENEYLFYKKNSEITHKDYYYEKKIIKVLKEMKDKSQNMSLEEIKDLIEKNGFEILIETRWNILFKTYCGEFDVIHKYSYNKKIKKFSFEL